MYAFVRFRLPDGSTSTLSPGDFIGRLDHAALHLDDARVSEAHAMVSLRGRELKLLALRGRFAIDGSPVNSAVLRDGLVIEVARGLSLVVDEVQLPEQVLALEGDGLPRQVLSGAMSLFVKPKPSLQPRYRSDAAAHLWNTGEGWTLSVVDGELGGEAELARALASGDSFVIDGVAFRVVAVEIAHAARKATRVEGAVQSPLTIVASYDTVHLHRPDHAPLALDGISARILSELVAFDGPVVWHVLAREIWRHEDDRGQLRRKWDVSLARLRRKLRAVGIRTDLIRAGGTGQIELLRYPGDRIDDRT